MKRDIERTKAAKFKDRRSYWGNDGHVYARGKDKGRFRAQKFEEHGEYCDVCGAFTPEHGSEFVAGHWHHVKRCSCPGCTEIRCNPFTGRKCHMHGVSGFQRVARRPIQEGTVEA